MTIRSSAVICAVTILLAAPFSSASAAQGRGGAHEPERPRANQGRLPDPPQRGTVLEREKLPSGRVNETPHVSNNHWYGHEPANEARFHLDRPFEHGRFAHTGPSFRYRVTRVDRDRHLFWFGDGIGFQIADWDWPFFADWCWNCGNDFVVYDDPSHIGWYLLYNVHLGQYVHATYGGF